jgi:CAAX protease family protein
MNTSAYRWAWPAFLVLALLFLGTGSGALYGIAVPLAALAIALAVPGARSRSPHSIDRQDLAVIGGLYVGVVGLFTLAFRVFTQDSVAGLFLAFAAGMLLGVVGPVVYTVWIRHRPLADLGLTRSNLGPAVALGLVLAAVQFALTLWGYRLPQPVDWVPLMVLSLTVGLFEAVFFRGFVQTRLESSFGPIAGVGGASALYAFYHVGYGMGPAEMLFLFGLGVVYGVAFAVVRNVAVLWPLLIPLGSFYNNLEASDIRMPWAAILGFADVLALMATAVWLAARHQRRDATHLPGGRPTPPRPTRTAST